MLTFSQIQIYEKFGGDIDGFARAHGDHSGCDMTDDDWRLIDRLRQALHLIETGWAAESFRNQTERELVTLTADDRTREALRRLART